MRTLPSIVVAAEHRDELLALFKTAALAHLDIQVASTTMRKARRMNDVVALRAGWQSKYDAILVANGHLKTLWDRIEALYPDVDRDRWSIDVATWDLMPRKRQHESAMCNLPSRLCSEHALPPASELTLRQESEGPVVSSGAAAEYAASTSS